jgi:hypothetical protein
LSGSGSYGGFPNQSSYKKRKTMSTENVTYALQVAATNGNGFSVFFREANFVTFRVTGNGPVTAGQVTIECCPPGYAEDGWSDDL